MSEAKNGEETKAPSATSLAEAVVAALATHDGSKTAEPGAKPDGAKVDGAKVDGEGVDGAKVDGEGVDGDDAPVVSAVAIGEAISVGAKKSDEPELSVAPATEAEVATEEESPPAAAPTEAAAAPAEPAKEPAAEPAKEPASEAAKASADETTAPRGLAVTREVTEGIGIRYFGRTDVGLVREHNEDNFLVVDVTQSRRGIDDKPIDAALGNRGLVLAVCDGMGGAAAGEVASQMAVDTIHEMMTAAGPPKDRDHFARRLVRAVEEAGSRIFSAAKLDRSRRGMGTTSTVAGLVDSTLFVGQVGDSRAYVLRGDQFALITKDQSLVNQLIEAGQLTEEEAEAFEHSNIILQALGTTEEVTVDLTFLELRRGDRLLLCSDGLSGLVHADMMKDVLRASRDLVEAANQLIAMANAGGGHDNITVIVAEFDGLGLKDPDGSAKVAYQQYPLPPATSDTIDPPPPRPTSVKPGAAKPGADVKSVPSLPPEAEGGGLGRWWLVVALVLLVLALLGAIFYTMDAPVADAPTTRTTLTSARRAEPSAATTPTTTAPSIGPIPGARAPSDEAPAVEDEPSEDEAVPMGIEPPPPPPGAEPPPGMEALPARPTPRPVEAEGSTGFVRRSGDTAHEPPPRPDTP